MIRQYDSGKRSADGDRQRRFAVFGHQHDIQQFGHDRHSGRGDPGAVEAGARQVDERVRRTNCGERLPREFPGVQFFFQPADIVTQILNFGTPAPMDVQIVGARPAGQLPDRGAKLANKMRPYPGRGGRARAAGLRRADTVHGHGSDARAIRGHAGKGRGAESAGVAVVEFSDDARVSGWIRRNGVSYNVAVQTPQYRVDTFQALQNTPISGSMSGAHAANSGKLGVDAYRGAPCFDLALQCAADDQCLRVGVPGGTWAAWKAR